MGYLLHCVTFFALAFFAKLTLRLVGIENAFAHLLFPFHFFEMAFAYAPPVGRGLSLARCATLHVAPHGPPRRCLSLTIAPLFLPLRSPVLSYAFFALRDTYVKGFTASWLAATLLIATNIILRNSGTYDGLLNLAYNRVMRRRARRRGLPPPPDPSGPSDVLFRLQVRAPALRCDLAPSTSAPRPLRPSTSFARPLSDRRPSPLALPDRPSLYLPRRGGSFTRGSPSSTTSRI